MYMDVACNYIPLCCPWLIAPSRWNLCYRYRLRLVQTTRSYECWPMDGQGHVPLRLKPPVDYPPAAGGYRTHRLRPGVIGRLRRAKMQRDCVKEEETGKVYADSIRRILWSTPAWMVKTCEEKEVKPPNGGEEGNPCTACVSLTTVLLFMLTWVGEDAERWRT